MLAKESLEHGRRLVVEGWASCLRLFKLSKIITDRNFFSHLLVRSLTLITSFLIFIYFFILFRRNIGFRDQLKRRSSWDIWFLSCLIAEFLSPYLWLLLVFLSFSFLFFPRPVAFISLLPNILRIFGLFLPLLPLLSLPGLHLHFHFL